MSNITDQEIQKLEEIMLGFGEAHNLLAKTSLSKDEYQPISGLLAKAKVELFNFYNAHKAALQNKVSDEDPNKDDIIKEAKKLWNIPNKLEAVKLIIKLGYSLKDAKAYCEENFDRKVGDVSAEEWKVFSHTSALGNTGDYMSDCGIENGTISFYCDKPDDITNEELQKICDNLNASIVNERKDSAGSKSIEDELHPDSEQLLKVCFEELRLKMIKSQKKYGWSNEWLTQDWEDECREQMIEHLQKGDPRDVAVYAMFMIYRGWTTNKKSLVNERKDNVGSWVSVEDRLPDVKKDGNKVLLFREMNESQKALSIGVHDTSMIKYCEKSSYWMPLPAPPVSQPQQKEVDGERLIF